MRSSNINGAASAQSADNRQTQNNPGNQGSFFQRVSRVASLIMTFGAGRAAAQQPQADGMLTHTEFRAGLRQWVQETRDDPNENRQEAANRISTCWTAHRNRQRGRAATELDLSSLNLTSLPLHLIGQLKKLKHLDVSFNELNSLQGLAALPNLETLNCQYNHLEDLSGIRNQPNLRGLFAVQNDFNGVPAGLAQMPLLHRVELTDGSFGDIDHRPNQEEVQTSGSERRIVGTRVNLLNQHFQNTGLEMPDEISEHVVKFSGERNTPFLSSKRAVQQGLQNLARG